MYSVKYTNCQTFLKKNNFMAPFCGWGSTASRLEPLRGGNLLSSLNKPHVDFEVGEDS